jgi:hypothetical protein
MKTVLSKIFFNRFVGWNRDSLKESIHTLKFKRTKVIKRLILLCQISMECRVFNTSQDFKLEGTHLKKCAERREARKYLGYFVWKITILRQKNLIFSNFRGVRPLRPCKHIVKIWLLYSRHYLIIGNLAK